MKETKKERNYVTVFSDYGLDERQRSKSENIGFRCFRELYIVLLIMTVVWYVIGCAVDANIPVVIVAGSYFAAATVCYCIYTLRAAKAGVINGITAFSFSTGSLVQAIAAAVLAICLSINAAGSVYTVDKMINRIALIVLCAIFSAENFVLYFCGLKNNKVLDEQNKEEE